MNRQKRVAAIHDISGFGKCSLTVALPIISAAGIETSVMPTAVLSTHTGGFTGFTYRDLTEDLMPFVRHWQTLGIGFDALYSGFLGSFEQLELVGEIFDMLKGPGTQIMVDPVMADYGKLYDIFPASFPRGMKKLCEKANILIPNITEASLMLEKPYKDGPYSEEYISDMVKALYDLNGAIIVLTGVWFNDTELGVAVYSGGHISYAMGKRIPGAYHGTGDVYGSALLAAMLNEQSPELAAQTAVDFTVGSIQRSHLAGTDMRFGVNFEAELPNLIKALGL